MDDLYLVAGLGNPGREYEHTRHNVGFMCADALARAHGLAFDPKKRSKARVAVGSVAGKRLAIAAADVHEPERQHRSGIGGLL